MIDISFDIACEYGRLIETIPMSKEEFERSLGSSPFLWEVLKFGKPLFTPLESPAACSGDEDIIPFRANTGFNAPCEPPRWKVEDFLTGFTTLSGTEWELDFKNRPQPESVAGMPRNQ